MIRHIEERKTETRENMRGGTGEVTIQHFFNKDEFTANARLCARLTLPPGASIGSHQHENEDEVYVIEQGRGILDDSKSRYTVTAGDAVLTGQGESHAIANDGDDDLIITAVIMCY